jgi:hypothetical protein
MRTARTDVAGACVAVTVYAGLALAARLVTARDWRALRDAITRRG